MSRPVEVSVIAYQELASPDRPVGPITRAVERNADHRFVQVVFGHATGHVGVVMLDGKQPHVFARRPLTRVVRRGIVGMQIVHDHLGGDSK